MTIKPKICKNHGKYIKVPLHYFSILFIDVKKCVKLNWSSLLAAGDWDLFYCIVYLNSNCHSKSPHTRTHTHFLFFFQRSPKVFPESLFSLVSSFVDSLIWHCCTDNADYIWSFLLCRKSFSFSFCFWIYVIPCSLLFSWMSLHSVPM